MRTKDRVKKENSSVAVKERTKPVERVKPIEIEETAMLPETEDKLLEDPATEEVESEESEDAELADEDIDPFGDKWEQ